MASKSMTLRAGMEVGDAETAMEQEHVRMLPAQESEAKRRRFAPAIAALALVLAAVAAAAAMLIAHSVQHAQEAEALVSEMMAPGAGTGCLNWMDIQVGRFEGVSEADCEEKCRLMGTTCRDYNYQVKDCPPGSNARGPTFCEGHAKGSCLLLSDVCVQEPNTAWVLRSNTRYQGPKWTRNATGTGCKNWEQIMIGQPESVIGFSACGDACFSNEACVQFNFQKAPGSQCGGEGLETGTCYLYGAAKDGSAACETESNSCWDLYDMNRPFFNSNVASLHTTVVCPVIGALINNFDLVPDCSSGTCLINLADTRQAFLRLGISPEVTDETTLANFRSPDCPTCGDPINPFAMNVIQCGPSACIGRSPKGFAHEHFRSTGIRDGFSPNATAFDWAELNCLGPEGTLWTREGNRCLGNSFDCETAPCDPFMLSGNMMFNRMLSNDVDEDKRPPNCTSGSSGVDVCNSQLQGAIDALFMEFGTSLDGPPMMTKAEQRGFWLEGIYPKDFLDFSPRTCIDLNGAVGGCGKCQEEIEEASSPEVQERLQRRYCVCLRSQEIHDVETTPEFKSNCEKFVNTFFFGDTMEQPPPDDMFGNFWTGPTYAFNETEFMWGRQPH